ncbi:YjbQ family protein [Streptomycetaceae bacterium NBC_01309]
MGDAFTTRVLDIRTGTSETVYDLTADIAAFLRDAAAGRDGLLNVFTPHATAGLAVIETGSGSDDDAGPGGPPKLAALPDLLPADDRWRHRHGSPGHGRDHVLPAFVPPHATLPVLGGRLELGTWQSVVLVDTNRDNPNRQVRLSFLG